MTNSNDRNNLATDQTDDLIAELARIVADDAKQASVSKSVDERAQLAADAREKKDAQRSFEHQIEADQASPDIAQPQTEQGAGEILPFSKSGDTAPFSQIGEGVTAIRTPSPTKPSDEMQEPANTTGSAFEFDFSHNIKMGVDNAADSRSETEDLDFAPSQMDEMAEAASFDVDETIPTPDVLDGIAAIIEDVEHQSAEPVAPQFDPIPVPSGTASQPNDDQSEVGIEAELSDNLERRSAAPGGDFEYIPQQNLQVPVGEDEFAVPPSQTSDGADLSEEVEDPLTEIENLIADTNSPPTTNPQPADAAEAAILAALASAAGTRPSVEKSPVAAARASTAQLREPRLEPEAPTARDFVDPVAHQSVQPERKANYDDEPRRGGSILPIVASVAAIVLLAVVGGVAYWFFVGQNPAGQDIPVVSAQNTQVKETPAVTPSETGGSSVFTALDGNAEPTAQEQIVSRDETAGASGADVARVVTPNSSSGGLTNRKVKTVTVLADGTIVSGTESSAGAEQLPQDVRPNAPTVAVETTTAATDEIANVLNAIKEGTEVASQTEVAPTAEPVAVETATAPIDALPDDPTAPQPPARPSGLGFGVAPTVAINTTPVQADTSAQPISLLPTANVSAPAPATNSATSAGVSAPFYVQLASQRSVETAQSTASLLQRKFPSILGSQTIDINQVDLGEKGIYFRVRVPSNSLADANALCSSLKSSGGDCFVRNN